MSDENSPDHLPRLLTLAEVHHAAMAGTLAPESPQTATAEPVLDVYRRWPHLSSSDNPEEVSRIVERLTAAWLPWPVAVRGSLLDTFDLWVIADTLRLRGQHDARQAERRRQEDLANEAMALARRALKRLDDGVLPEVLKDDLDYILSTVELTSAEVPEFLLEIVRGRINEINEWLVANKQGKITNELLAELFWLASGMFEEHPSRESTIRMFRATPHPVHPPASKVWSDPDNWQLLGELVKRVPGPRSDKYLDELLRRLLRFD